MNYEGQSIMQLASSEAEIKTLENDVAVLQNDVNLLQADVSILQADVNALEMNPNVTRKSARMWVNANTSPYNKVQILNIDKTGVPQRLYFDGIGEPGLGLNHSWFRTDSIALQPFGEVGIVYAIPNGTTSVTFEAKMRYSMSMTGLAPADIAVVELGLDSFLFYGGAPPSTNHVVATKILAIADSFFACESTIVVTVAVPVFSAILRLSPSIAVLSASIANLNTLTVSEFGGEKQNSFSVKII